MKAINFTRDMIKMAEHQEEYNTLPCHRDREGCVTICWKLSWRERFRILFSGILWHQILTFNDPLQPIRLDTKKPHVKEEEV